jgi:5-methylcytosine-specific restriction endonuclease McrA
VRKEDIKRHLKTYSVYEKRKTTINHAFASAIAPADPYSEATVSDALTFLGQDPNSELLCVFCDAQGETWDHLVGLVKNGELKGYGHQIGNLVPCCKECNSKKGSKEFLEFISGSSRISKNKDDLIALLVSYQENFSVEIDLTLLRSKRAKDFDEFVGIKNEIFELMKKADNIAAKLRREIV